MILDSEDKMNNINRIELRHQSSGKSLRRLRVSNSAIAWGVLLLYLASVKATSPDSQKFLQYFMGRRKFSTFMSVVSTLTVLAGGLLYWHDSLGLRSNWIFSGAGMGFSVGALFGITVLIYGGIALGRPAARIGRISQDIAAAGLPPTAEQLAELKKLDEGMTRAGRLDFALILLALIAMATARYL